MHHFVKVLKKLEEQKRLPFEVSYDDVDAYTRVVIKYTNCNYLSSAKVTTLKVDYDNVYAAFNAQTGTLVAACPENSNIKLAKKGRFFPHMSSRTATSVVKNLTLFQQVALNNNFCFGSSDYASYASLVKTANAMGDRSSNEEVTPKNLSKVLLYILFSKEYLMKQSSQSPHNAVSDIRDLLKAKVSRIVDLTTLEEVDNRFLISVVNRVNERSGCVYNAIRTTENEPTVNFVNLDISRNRLKTYALDLTGLLHLCVSKDEKKSFLAFVYGDRYDDDSSHSTQYDAFLKEVPICTFNTVPVFMKVLGGDDCPFNEGVTFIPANITVADILVNKYEKTLNHNIIIQADSNFKNKLIYVKI